MSDNTESTPRAPRIERWEWFALASIALLVVITRIPTLEQPLIESHSFRQTQTAIQTVTFFNEGIDWLRPQVPVFGQPWAIPFEFPLFQAVASALMSWGFAADVANRVTGLIFFMATAAALWVLIRTLTDRTTAMVGLVVFSFSPFGILWSRSSMIEYLATFGAIVWVIGAIRWRETRSTQPLVVAIVAGTIGALVKLSTVFAWIVPLLLFAPAAESASNAREWIRRRLDPAFIAIAGIPGLAGVIWTMHADAVKGASETTTWLVSSALREWNFGTIAQRLDGANLQKLLDRIDDLIVGPGWLIVAVVAVLLATRHRATWIGLLLVPVVAIGTIFNLYLVHDYYLAAIAPALAAVVALAITTIARWLAPHGNRIGPIVMGLTVVWLIMATGLNREYWNQAYRDFEIPEISDEIADLTDADDRIILGSHDWSPRTLYYAERKGMMLVEPPLSVDVMARQPDLDEYRLLWVPENARHLVEYAAVRPWFAPVTGNSLLLAESLEALGAPRVAGSTAEAAPTTGTPIGIGSIDLACDATASVEIPAGSGSVWLSVHASDGVLILTDGALAPMPSATRTVVVSPNTADGDRSALPIRCSGGGTLRLDVALEIGG